MIELVGMYPSSVGLAVVVLAVYGFLHGRLIVRFMRGRAETLIPWILWTSPFGVGVPILTLALLTGPYTMTGWEAAIATVALEGVAFVPLAAVIAREILHTEKEGRLGLNE